MTIGQVILIIQSHELRNGRMSIETSFDGIHTRDEHLEWSKKRALEYVDAGDHKHAFASFMSDMRKHSETAKHPALHGDFVFMFVNRGKSADQVREWIEGFA